MAQPVTLDRASQKDILLTTQRESLWKDALRRLVRNRAAVIGGVIILILYLTAIFADKIALILTKNRP